MVILIVKIGRSMEFKDCDGRFCHCQIKPDDYQVSCLLENREKPRFYCICCGRRFVLLMFEEMAEAIDALNEPDVIKAYSKIVRTRTEAQMKKLPASGGIEDKKSLVDFM